MKSRTVLVVDDEPELLQLVVTYLKNHSYLAITAGTGEEALQVIQEREVDLVILDIMMEGMDGFAVCETIRRNYALPVIMLTARSHEEDKIRALKLGADDYIVKPFSPKELMARVEATIRRSYELIYPTDKLVFGELLIDRHARMVQVDQKELVLTRREYDLLLFLAEHKNRSFSREQLFTNVWTDVSTSSLRTVDTHIKTLRLKLGTSGKRIQTVWGVGYKFGERE
ncbi:two-component system OmpR family response regulator [Alkalihalobacillus xiaoxiensis]|uniref:Two-component system OmpR family response regulator n=1 Tax=Shouchella xiaoxiensis TaxID=766895 RepID=A0ABS2SW16_9BACI|nr:response regulator transcription factor [Shouchella xiaoxiensis]MBM7839717.1 two-component system OmpR family response regulator [Shouchella xiaoxiensis]